MCITGSTWLADERERLADERKTAGGERERLADERKGTAEQRGVERREPAEAAGERRRHDRPPSLLPHRQSVVSEPSRHAGPRRERPGQPNGYFCHQPREAAASGRRSRHRPAGPYRLS